MTEKINRETAETEIEAWLDYKKVFQETRDKYKDNIETLIEAVMNGVLEIGEDRQFKHKLLFPIGDGGSITDLKYKARLTGKQIDAQMKGVKADDVDGRLAGLIAALTSESRSIIGLLDTADRRVALAIAIFFM